MNRSSVNPVIIAISLSIGVGLAIAPAARAASPHASCTSRTLSGLYNYAYTGFSVGADHARVPFSVAGVSSYDGAGHIRGVSTTMNAGTVSAAPVPYQGVYSVSSDCQIVETDTDATGATTHFIEYTGTAGNAVSFLETDPGTFSTGTETRD